ncbi:KTSC domain-containing protein [soil metagenome]
MPQTASSVIARIDYNAHSRELHVTFTSGRRYRYSGVPAEVYFQFCRAASKGEFFNALIKDRYPFTEHR